MTRRILLSFFLALVGNAALSAPLVAEVKHTGWLVAGTNGRYQRTEGKAEITYRNPLVSETATVVLEVYYEGRRITSQEQMCFEDQRESRSIVMRPLTPGVWQTNVTGIYHALAAKYKSSRINFRFRIEYAGQDPAYDLCEQKYWYGAYLPRFDQLSWQKAGVTPDRKALEVDCVRRVTVVKPLCSEIEP